MALIDTMVDDSGISSKRWKGWHIIGFVPEGITEVVYEDDKGLLTKQDSEQAFKKVARRVRQ